MNKKYLVQVIAYYDVEVEATSKSEAVLKANEYGLNDMILQQVIIPQNKAVILK